jgi:hypothetical protein
MWAPPGSSERENSELAFFEPPVQLIGRCGGSKGSNLGSFILNKTRLFDIKGQIGSTISQRFAMLAAILVVVATGLAVFSTLS